MKGVKWEMIADRIYLNDIIQLSEKEIENTKLRFMVPSKHIGFDPNKDAEDSSKQDYINLKHLVHNPQKKISFRKGTIAIGFIKIREDHWLMTGIVDVTRDNGISRPAEAIYRNKKYNFRLVVKYHKNSQAGIRIAKDLINTLEVVEIWNPNKSLGDKAFPGYKSVTISFNDLDSKLQNSDEWRNALSLRKGVYLITDKKTGKLYVGSAYGKNGILGRWETYLKSGYDKNEMENGKYPNKNLRELVKEKGMTYIKDNFQYSILETFTEDVSDEYIISRETWWKEALQSRKFGYNAN